MLSSSELDRLKLEKRWYYLAVHAYADRYYRDRYLVISRPVIGRPIISDYLRRFQDPHQTCVSVFKLNIMCSNIHLSDISTSNYQRLFLDPVPRQGHSLW